MIYTPKNEIETMAIDMALLAGCLYHTYGLNRVRMFYRVERRNPDGTFELTPVDAPLPAQAERPGAGEGKAQ